MNRLTTEKRAQVVRALVEGNSIRATVRMTGVAKNTVSKLLIDLGAACLRFSDRVMVNLPCKRVQCDEIWAFCYAKEKNVAPAKQGELGYGDTWTWTAIDADTKLVPCWHVGKRTPDDAHLFISDLAGRLSNWVQLSTDGLKMYLTAVASAFGNDIDYAMIVKTYGDDPVEGGKRYSPAKCTGIEKKVKIGNPAEGHISTSYVERQNLTMRMGMRRFTRLTNAFSKKLLNLVCAISLHFTFYNFARPPDADEEREDADHARDGCRSHGSRLEHRGDYRATRHGPRGRPLGQTDPLPFLPVWLSRQVPLPPAWQIVYTLRQHRSFQVTPHGVAFCLLDL